MNHSASRQKISPPFLIGGGEMGERIRSLNWSETKLGEFETWPQSLQSALSICINSNFPIAIYWGHDLTLIYNDAWSPIPGNKHPWALGRPAKEVWPEIWRNIGPLFKEAFEKNVATGSRDALLPMERHGYVEECYFDFTFTPIYGESGNVEGIFNAVIETTYRVINERRAFVLQRLNFAINSLHTPEDIILKSAEVLEEAKQDIPFFFIYRMDASGKLVLSTKSSDYHGEVLTSWPFESIEKNGTSFIVKDLDSFFSTPPQGYWPELPKDAYLLALKGMDGNIIGYLVCGISSRRTLDKEYRAFFDSIGSAISGELNTIFSLQAEKKRVEALAEIDRVKTAFFSNISHEFRTPLTLMLSPLEEVLEESNGFSNAVFENLNVVHRNTIRLQKLVNTLLDFSRIEAGRMQTNFVDVNLGLLTADLASSFRSAVEKAGMKLIVECDDAPNVHVDIDMWENIVLNLLSNAFKYSLEGSINVRLKNVGERVELKVSDTGTGIPLDELNKIFERFHRSRNVKGRSQEGTGIGLAMVKELVKLHDGVISVESEVGNGTTFTVSIPSKKQFSPPKEIDPETHIRSTNSQRDAYLQEVTQWNSSAEKDAYTNTLSTPDSFLRTDYGEANDQYTVLLADDNADMRHYIERLLSIRYKVVSVSNGIQAYDQALLMAPDIIISDIMMPELDGFGLLKKVRSTLSTKNIPVIFLSARAGEESRIEGLNAGADDYLVKPFSAKELLARVNNHVSISAARRKTEKEFFNLFLQSPAHIHVMRGPEHILEFFHPLGIPFAGRDITGLKMREAVPALEGQGFFEMLDQVYNEGITIRLPESKAVFKDKEGVDQEFYFNITYLPWKDFDGKTQGILQFTFEVTDQVKARQKIQENEERLRIATETAALGTWEYDPKADLVHCSEKTLELFGFTSGVKVNLERTLNAIVEEDRSMVAAAIRMASDPTGDGKYEAEYGVISYHDNIRREVKAGGRFFFENNVPIRFIGTVVDITERKKAERELRASEQRFRILATSIPQIVWTTDVVGKLDYLSEQWEQYTGQKIEDGMKDVLALVHPEDLKILQFKVENAMRLEQHWEAEYRLKNLYTGQYRWFTARTVPLKDGGGRIIKWIGSASDIHHLKEQSSWLEQQVQDRTRALKELNQSLKTSNEDLQQFAHVASHDLKEPIRKIKTFSSRLQEDYSSVLPEKAALFIQKIQSATDRMYSMIDGVLSYSTLASADQPTSSVDLNEVLLNIRNDLEVLIQEKNAVIISDRLPTVEGAPVLLYQLVYNLINNSIKFSKKDEAPKIQIESSSAHLENNEFIKLVIRDNGIGFDQEQADSIFGTFTRLNSKDKYEGTGLGLALCKKIVQRHGGFISAKGEKNKGATFTILLPLN